jgi:general secretion pathway protein K
MKLGARPAHAPGPSPRPAQRGVALLVALVLMALVAIITYDVWFSGLFEQRRTIASLSLEQGLQYALGAEIWAAQILQQDTQNNAAQDHFAEAWATPIPPIPVDGGQIEGGLEDLQGRFNLNDLIDPTTGAANPEAVEQFRRLLELAGLEQSWSDKMVDWIDADNVPTIPDGAEDAVYMSQSPPYLAANGPITSTSEMLALPQFGIERYRKIAPFIAALPTGTPINVCTAPGEVLDSLAAGFRQFSVDPKALAQQRTSKCFPTLNDLQATLPPADWQRLQKSNGGASMVAENTRYFRLTSVVTIGTAQFTLYSLLLRDKSGQVWPILRSWGTD